MPENAPADKKEAIKVIYRPDAAVFNVKVIAGSSRTALAGVQNGMLRIKVSAAPEKGKANEALVEFLAEKLGVKKKFVRITAGLTSKIKQIAVEQIAAEILIEKLENAL